MKLNSAAIRAAYGRPGVEMLRRRWNWYKAVKNICVVIAVAIVIASFAVLVTTWFGGW